MEEIESFGGDLEEEKEGYDRRRRDNKTKEEKLKG